MRNLSGGFKSLKLLLFFNDYQGRSFEATSLRLRIPEGNSLNSSLNNTIVTMLPFSSMVGRDVGATSQTQVQRTSWKKPSLSKISNSERKSKTFSTSNTFPSWRPGTDAVYQYDLADSTGDLESRIWSNPEQHSPTSLQALLSRPEEN